MRGKVHPRDLKAGMILAKDLRLSGANVPAMARGITDAEITAIRKCHGSPVEIRRSLPFTPIFAAGFLLFLAVSTGF